ncbi:MAG: GPH family glycoside/pentoside/hexuronide:cation symporter, partial [Halieaceae bacterium]
MTQTNSRDTTPDSAADAEYVSSIRPAPFAVKALNGFNGAVDNLMFIAYELFILFYYSQVLGLSGTLTGAAILVSMIVDALTDPVIGSWSDNIRSRFGRRHLFMFASILPIGLSFWLLFTPPPALESLGLFVWLTVMSVAVRVSLTFFSAPASAVTAEISPLKSDRADMGIYRQIVASVGQFSLLYLAFSVFFHATPEFENGQENAAAYPEFALALSLIVMSCMALGSWATFGRIREFEEKLGAPGSNHFNLRKALGDWINAIIKVPNFRAVLFGLFFATLMGTTYRAMSIYLGTYLWEFTPEQIKNWQQIVLVGMFIMAIASRFIVPRTDPKKPYLTAFTILILMYGLPPLLTAMDILPPPGDPMLAYIVYTFNAIV